MTIIIDRQSEKRLQNMDREIQFHHYKCQDIARELERDMIHRNLAPGVLLPGTAELALRYHVSTKTIHRALQQLSRRKLIRRIPGVGSVVVDSMGLTPHSRIGVFLFSLLDSDPRELGQVLADQSTMILRNLFENAGHRVVSHFQAFTPVEKIAPGKWFWRVITDDGVKTETRSFTQTADLMRDCDAPLIHATPTYLGSSTEPLTFAFTEVGKLKTITAKYAGESLICKQIAPNLIAVNAPQKGWKKGVGNLSLELTFLCYEKTIGNKVRFIAVTTTDKAVKLSSGEEIAPLGRIVR